MWFNWEKGKIWNDTDILWHAGTSERNWKNNLNRFSIWIEIVNNWETFSDIQRKNVDDLVKELIQKHNIKKENLVRHKDIAPWRKTDPYDSLWNTRFKTFEDYKNYLYFNNDIMKEFENLRGYDLFSTNEDDYKKTATIWDIKDLIEAAFLRYDEKKINWELKQRN